MLAGTVALMPPARQRNLADRVASMVRPELTMMSRQRTRSLGHRADTLDDPELVKHIADPACMAELISRHQGRLMSMATSMLRNRADAEEAVQDTFFRAHRAGTDFRGDAKVSTWLHTICYRQVLTRTRRKRHLTVAIDSQPEQASQSEDQALRIALRRAVDDLPEANREAFTLVDILGFSRTEAATILDVQDNTMRARVARARQLLAEALSSDDEEPQS